MQPAKIPGYNEESAAVQAHLQIIQSVIQRMATNSTSCKAWCIALVSAILVVIADKGNADYAFIAVIPTVLFLALDAYYLGLERCLRCSYNAFIDKVHSATVESCDLYAVTPKGSIWRSSLVALRSFSIWPFYLTLAALIILVQRCVLGGISSGRL